MTDAERRVETYKTDKQQDIVLAEKKLRRLKHELREHVCYITADFPMLSQDWCRMAESLNQIATVAGLELELAPKKNVVTDMSGKKSSGTLWDQERDEFAVRTLLEEGKLNLVLRMLHEYCVIKRDKDEYNKRVAAAAAEMAKPVEYLLSRCRIFEEGAGVLLMHALKHVESVQIVDMPEVIQHCAEVLRDHNNADQPMDLRQNNKCQEVVVLEYVASIVLHMEAVDEERVMDVLEEHRVVPLYIQFLHQRADADLTRPQLITAATTLHRILHSDPCSAEPTRWMPRSEHDHMLALKPTLVDALLAANAVNKKDIRALVDFTAKLERKHRALRGAA